MIKIKLNESSIANSIIENDLSEESVQELQKLVQSLSIISELMSEPYEEEIRKLVVAFVSVTERVQTALDTEDGK